MKFLKYIPLFLFLIISVFLFNKIKFQKKLEPLSSALIEKKFPTLEIYTSDNSQNINYYLQSRPVVVNVFASWCAPCRAEHQVLKKYSAEYEIIGIVYKDTRENISSFLEELGNPYKNIFYDYTGRESINLGLYGVPETFFVNKGGVIVYKHVGPIKDEEFKKIAPMVFNK